MWYNHAKAEAVFKQEWTQKEHICRESGMTDAQIQELYDLEREIFNSDRRFYEHCEMNDKLLSQMQITFDHLESLNRQIEADKPKVAFADHVACSDSLIDMNTMSKLAKHNGIKIGQNRLFEWLRDNGILMKNNVPYQQYMERGYFKVREGSFTVNGETRLYHKTLVTGKGQLYIIRKLLEEYADDAND